MDTRTAEYVVAVADTGHFAVAAQRCHVTPSTLSIQIKTIEHQLGARLFDRGSHPVQLTHEGRQLLPYFAEIACAMRSLRRCADYLGYYHRVASRPREHGPHTLAGH